MLYQSILFLLDQPRFRLIAAVLTLTGIASSTTAETIDFSGSYRLRYESLHNGPRPDSPESDELLVSRLFAQVKFEHESLIGLFEIQDSRAWLASTGTPLGTDDVNALEPLQAWIGWRGTADFPLQVIAGRMTKQLSTRRLVARNRFRNTSNSFSGIDAEWSGDRWRVNGFFLRPVQREPQDRRELERNRARVDETSSGQVFWGFELAPAQEPSWSIHLLGLEEEDRDGFPTRDRDLVTFGAQYNTVFASNGGWHHAGEVAIQTGRSRASLDSEDRNDLDHTAWFAHGELGFTWNTPWNPRVTLSMDYGTGDRDPTDNKTERFDTLFGARRFEYGPSGIYAVQARSNIVSPELRWTAMKGPFELMAAWRSFWLEQPLDTHAGTGFRQKGDTRDRWVGHQVEGRVRYSINRHWQLESGAVHLDKGPVLGSDAFAQGGRDAVYIYLQTHWRW
ncbi:conserved hypothetical protein [Luminiphilus syltensis NOR5-1B]|uniref:Alginate export domain-containing protein n=1 Tax=Luminiphilus syltensis NOR5-1B TaxID=565045 RepID=B8KXF6_9GAMM|nr:alginate export family protein [Luminiphilus syltensis]EED34136.1 conserved hypothetical protein [Luminiphilus syltensis NOR5-1B]